MPRPRTVPANWSVGGLFYGYLASPAEMASSQAPPSRSRIKDAQKLPAGSVLMFKIRRPLLEPTLFKRHRHE